MFGFDSTQTYEQRLDSVPWETPLYVVYNQKLHFLKQNVFFSIRKVFIFEMACERTKTKKFMQSLCNWKIYQEENFLKIELSF